jgi:NADH:ubiquinone oxidoreductase subunit 5 (subunit L)/multisubunit Na+/H+ antiporter MnhA subunit
LAASAFASPTIMSSTFENLAWSILLAPALAGLLSLLCRKASTAAVTSIVGSLAAFSVSLLLLLHGETPGYPSLAWAPELGLSVTLRLDAATLALAAMISFIGAIILQFAAAYFGSTDKGRRAIGTLALFEAAMLGLVLSDDLLALFVFWELTGICSFFLIRTDADKRDDAFPAAKRALLVTAGGALPMLIGFLYLAQVGGSTRLSELVGADLTTTQQTVVFGLVLLGVITKSAQWPFHFWLPGAMAAPTPISAFLHSATMVKAGIILLLYLQPIAAGSPYWMSTLVPLGAVTCVWGAYQALTQDDIKLLMAWSTVSQLGLLTITAGLGTDLAVRAALLHLFAHAVFKAGLFLTVGAIDHAAHTRSLESLGGLRKASPVLVGIAVVFGGSMMGLPPFAGFLSKELILEKVMLAHPVVHAIAIAGIALGSVGTVAYTLRFLTRTFWGAPRSEGARLAQAPAWSFLAGPAILAGVTLVVGLGAPGIDALFLEPASTALVGRVLEAPTLALWHGITPALLWSVGIITFGVLLVRRMRGRALREVVRFEGADGFESFMGGAQRTGQGLAKVFAGLNPNVYFAVIVLGGLGAALPLVTEVAKFDLNVPLGGGVLFGMLAALLAILLVVRGRLTRALTLGLIGCTVAVLFRLLSAPDLMLTQLLVEVLMTVFLALSLRLLMRHPIAPRKPIGPRLGQIAIALLAGLGAAGLAAALLVTPRDTRLLSFYLEAAPEIAKGKNLVNVILVDFRSLDTLVETIVVVLAALGVAGLALGREVPLRARPDATSRREEGGGA